MRGSADGRSVVRVLREVDLETRDQQNEQKSLRCCLPVIIGQNERYQRNRSEATTRGD